MRYYRKTVVDLSDYYKKSEIDSSYYKKADADKNLKNKYSANKLLEQTGYYIGLITSGGNQLVFSIPWVNKLINQNDFNYTFLPSGFLLKLTVRQNGKYIIGSSRGTEQIDTGNVTVKCDSGGMLTITINRSANSTTLWETTEVTNNSGCVVQCTWMIDTI